MSFVPSDAVCCYSLSKSFLGSCVCVGTSQEQLKSAAEKFLELDCSVTDTRMVHIDGPRTEHTLDETNKTTCVSATETDKTEESCLENSSNKVSPHFCSKHQRWVSNLLCECPMESSEEQPHQVSEISPSLFTSTSSSDLTPSDLPVPPEQHLSPSTTNQLQEVEENPKTVEPVDLASPLHPAPPPAESFIAGASVLKVVIVPCMDITPVTICPGKSSATPNDIQMGNNEDLVAASSTVSNSARTLTPQTVTSSKPFISELSRRFRLGEKYLQSQFEGNGAKKVCYSSHMNLMNKGSDASFSTHSTSGMDITCNTQKYVDVESSFIDHMASSQNNLTFINNNMKPCVVLKRMSIEECLRITKGRFQCVQCVDMRESIDPDVYIFNVNSLYSSSSSEDETDSDTEYRPTSNTLKRWSRGLLPI
ncbi:hypothetical protein NL108_003100 [Boleophthalmus pectinirostris]|nr:hypothetical protein NL108_003100 [Boleophthalmus pectinirostris]